MSEKRKRAWQDEFDVAARVLKDDPGALEWATDDYVAFRYREPTARIVFYPHKSSAGNYHLRIRDEGSKDKARFIELAARLYMGAGHNCTFQVKNTPIPFNRGEDPGWAANEVLGREI